MNIDTKGIYEIGKVGNKIVLTYETEDDAQNANMKMFREQAKEIDKMFPDGIF